MPKFDPKIFKAYDVRGIVPDELDSEVAHHLGRALVTYLRPKQVAVGGDMRLSSPELFKSLCEGITSQGAEVVDLGLTSTDGLYFAVGKFGYDAGVMVTASHNSREYNGFKICRGEAVPLSGQKGLEQIKGLMISESYPEAGSRGRISRNDIAAAYTEHVLSFIDRDKIKPFKIVIDAGNGMAGKIVPQVFSHLPCEVVPMYFELDGRFPNHLASPIEPENTEDLRENVVAEKADFGAAFDGDADRMFLVDEKGETLGGDMVTALVAKNLLKNNPGATILYNLICSKTVAETVTACKGKAVRTRVGHALIKPLMKKHNGIFGGEHSGHFYFRDNWYADSGLIALLVCVELLSTENRPLSELVATIDHYYRSGEINSYVEDIPAKLRKLEKVFSLGGEVDHLDGLTIDYGDWWFNVRGSNTEPLIRLNIEAEDPAVLEEKKEALLKVIRS
jgi:phosphomannomutase